MRMNFILPLLIVCPSCLAPNTHRSAGEAGKEIRGIKITSQFPYLDTNGKLVAYLPNQTNLFYTGDQVLYQTFYYARESNTSRTANPRFVHYNYVYTKGNIFGILTDSARSVFQKKIRVDSMLAREWSASVNFKFLFSENKTVFGGSQILKSGARQDLYYLTGKQDSSMKGELRLEFSPGSLRNIDYSFSKELDTVKGMKLSKVEMINYARFNKEAKVNLDRVEIPYMMEEITGPVPVEVRNMFELDKKLKE